MGKGKSRNEAKVSGTNTETVSSISTPIATIISAVLGLIGVLVASFFAYKGIQAQIYEPLHITETAMAQGNAVQQTDLPATNMPVVIAVSETPVYGATAMPIITIAQPSQDEFSLVPVINVSYQDIPFPGMNEYDVKISRNKSYLWTYLWCSKFEGNLVENLAHMEFSFYINDAEIDISNFLVMRSTSTNDWPCKRWTTRLGGWNHISAPDLSVVYKISDLIFDGVSTYESGVYRHEINLIYID
jgi:hypothetical protein